MSLRYSRALACTTAVVAWLCASATAAQEDATQNAAQDTGQDTAPHTAEDTAQDTAQDTAHEARVVVVAPVTLMTTAARVRGELRTRGFDAVVATEHVAAERVALEAFARERGAIAVLLLRPSERGIEVWVVDRLTQKTVLREVVRTADDETLARRAVEVLRASLLEIELSAPTRAALPSAVRAILPTRSAVERPPEQARARPWLTLAIAPSVVWSPGGLGAFLAVDVRTEARVWRGLALGLRARLPTVPSALEVGALRSEQTFVWLGVAAAYHVDLGPLGLWGAGALSALSLRTSGSPPTPLVGVVAQRWVASVELELGASLQLARTFALFASASLVVAVPHARYLFVDEVVAEWGAPAVAAAFGVRVSFGD